jgi:hypothetical protein
VNTKWIDFFNKGDFADVASLYTEDATAFPPGSPMVKGRAAIEVMWKTMAEQVADPKPITVDVKPLGLCRQRRPTLVFVSGPSVFNGHVLALDVASLFQTLMECGEEVLRERIG